jgi:hypothetical protein
MSADNEYTQRTVKYCYRDFKHGLLATKVRKNKTAHDIVRRFRVVIGAILLDNIQFFDNVFCPAECIYNE